MQKIRKTVGIVATVGSIHLLVLSMLTPDLKLPTYSVEEWQTQGQQLLAKATETVKAKLMAARPEAAEEVHRTLGKVARELQSDRPTRDYSEAQHLVQLMNREGKLSEAAVLEFARTNKFEEAIAALALRCSAPIDIIDRLMQGDRIDALLIPCKAAGLAWPTTRAIIRLNPIHSTTTEDAFDAAKQDFNKLSVAAAQRIMRFWQVRSSATLMPT